ncbi:MAG TPA: PaaI family thioesterase [Hydrogenophaga sp.]|uniref:PaaI family thioesterase n=1 Tax=Hydrogenophaga sp. TaxID=1904254 RepID=UPI002BD160F1|nr:PaaI family thioesterase [Hydrogenophaga sp.]HSX94659.1 PaaI family thioesterase [Hydrogenophaga sp.]
MAAFRSSPVAEHLDFSVRIPFVDLLGFRLIRMDGGEAEITYEPAPEHLNSFDVVHGGASMTLLDVVMAHAARSVQTDMGCITIEMKTSFMRAAKGPLVARGKLLHRTATMAFTEASVFDAAGKLCSHATGTFKFVPRLPTGPGSVHTLNRISTD